MPTRPFIVALLIASLCAPTHAGAQSSQSGSLNFTGDKIALAAGIVAVAAAVVILVVLHKQSGSKVTGCVSSGPGEPELTTDRDGRSYPLGGDTSPLLPGHRMTLHLRKLRPKTPGTARWQILRSKDLGVCNP